MVAESIRKYIDRKRELEDVKKRIERLNDDLEQLIQNPVADTVRGTRSDGTYGPIKVVGIPVCEYERKRAQIEGRREKYEKIKRELEDMTEDVEQSINDIPDSFVRTILRYRYLDGMSWRQIGKKVKRSEDACRMIARRYFEK